LIKKIHGFWHVDISHHNIKNKQHRIRRSTKLPATPENHIIAQKYHDKLLVGIIKNTIDPDNSIFLSLAIEKFKLFSRANHEETTTEIYTYALKKMFEITGNIKIKDIQPDHIEQMKLTCKTATTFNTYRKHISAFFNWLIDPQELLVKNPVKKVKKMRVTKKVRRALAPYELKDLFTLAATGRKDFFNYLLMLLLTGCRRSELLRLQWKDVNFRQKYILLRNTKGKVDEPMPLNSMAINILKEHKGLERPFMFNPDYVTKKFKKYIVKAKLSDDLTLHCLRNTTVDVLIDSGLNLKDIQGYVRHSDIKTTMGYFTQKPERKLEGIDKMTEFIKKLSQEIA